MMNKNVLIPHHKYLLLMEKLDKKPETNSNMTPERSENPNVSEKVDISKAAKCINLLPKQFRKKGDMLIDYIITNGNNTIMWNDNGELIYQQRVIPNTHISDLIYDSMIKRKYEPLGVNEFYSGLAEINTPETLVMNENRKKFIRQMKMQAPESFISDQRINWIRY